MSTIADSLLAKVNLRRAGLGITQARLAATCGINQGHLSKVLAGKLKLAAKTEAALSAWLAETSDDVAGESTEIHDIVERLAQAPLDRRMQIMQLLRIVDRLAR